MNIGDRVRELRLERGWNASELGRRAGLPPATVTRVERGISQPTSATVAKLAKGLDVDPGDLFPKAGISPPSPVDNYVEAVRELEKLFKKDPSELRAHFEKVVSVDDALLKLAKRQVNDLPTGPERDAVQDRLNSAHERLSKLLIKFVASQSDLSFSGVERPPRAQSADQDTSEAGGAA